MLPIDNNNKKKKKKKKEQPLIFASKYNTLTLSMCDCVLNSRSVFNVCIWTWISGYSVYWSKKKNAISVSHIEEAEHFFAFSEAWTIFGQWKEGRKIGEKWSRNEFVLRDARKERKKKDYRFSIIICLPVWCHHIMALAFRFFAFEIFFLGFVLVLWLGNKKKKIRSRNKSV